MIATVERVGATVNPPAAPRRIAVDATFLKPGAVGGAEPMLRNLVAGLAAGGDEITVLTDRPWPNYAPGGRVTWDCRDDRGNRFVRGWAATRRHARHQDGILFPNYFTPPTPGRTARFVTAIHDLQYLHLPHNFSRAKRAWLRTAHELSLRLADQVVAISDFVRQDLLSRYGSRWERKVVTVPNPISWSRFDARPDPALWGRLERRIGGTDRPVVLSVAFQYPHKNLATLVRAYAELVRRGEEAQLVLVGQFGQNLVGVGRSTGTPELVRELGLEDRVVVTGYVDDGTLGELYRRATAFAFPSLFEGFGMPPVEALGFGIPVLTTRLTSLPEVTLGLAHHVEDALDPSELAERLAAILARPDDYRPTAEAVGRLRAHYAPARVAREYRRLLVGAD